MAAISAELRHQRARIARLTQSYKPDDPKLVEARRNLRALQLEEHVARVVDGWPPLTDEQCQRIAAMLNTGGAA